MIVKLPNGTKIEFLDKPRSPYQSRCIEDDAYLLCDDIGDYERVIREAKARNIPSKINLGYKEWKE